MIKKPTRDGNGFYWAEEAAKQELRWTGSRFDFIPIKPDGVNPLNHKAQQ
jgi:hypothetical protein